MKIKLAIPDQSEAEATLARLAVEAAQFVTPGNSLPKPSGDLLADCEALESFTALARVKTRLQTTPPPRTVAPLPAVLPVAPAAKAVAVTTGAKLNATQRAMAALGKALMSPAPARMTATEKCRAAQAPKIKAAAPTPAKIFVPMPPAFADKAAELRDAQSACVNLEIGMKSKGKSFQRPALTGEHVADVAALKSYAQALQVSFLSTVQN